MRRTEVNYLEKKTKILMISALLVTAIISSGVAAYAYANAETNVKTVSSNVMWYYNVTFPSPQPFWGRQCNGIGRFYGFGESLNVSQAFEDNVVNIAKNNTDVQTLLNEGYNITFVRPIMTATVEADGTVTLNATSAIVTLTQSTTNQNTTSTGRASVWVNLEEAKVTKTATTTRTVIENP